MAFNPSPKVAAARTIAREFGKRAVIVLMVGLEADGGMTLEYASYGETKDECDMAKALADVAYESVTAAVVGAAIASGAFLEDAT